MDETISQLQELMILTLKEKTMEALIENEFGPSLKELALAVARETTEDLEMSKRCPKCQECKENRKKELKALEAQELAPQ